MALILETMSAFTTILKASARPTNYQTLPTSDDHDEAAPVAGEGRKHDPAVYLSFWLFGAGTLLGWSGERFRPGGRSLSFADILSAHVHVSAARVILPTGLEDWPESA